jgi:hypothetical protein
MRVCTEQDQLICSVSVAPEFRVDHGLNVRCLDDATTLVDQRNSKSLTVCLRAQRKRRLAISKPFVAPLGHSDEWQAKRRPHFRQHIFNAGALTLLAVFALLHDCGLDEARQTVGEHAARDFQVGMKIIEAADAVKRGPKDQQRPSIPNQLEAAGEIAMARGDRRAADDWRGCHGRNHLSCNSGLSSVPFLSP